MGRWMQLAISVTMSACLILSATEAFAQGAGYPCRNRSSDPTNPICWDDYSKSGGRCTKNQCDQKKADCLQTCKGSNCSGCSSLSCNGACASLLLLYFESKHVSQVADCRAVDRKIRRGRKSLRIRQIVAAPLGERLQPPVELDELQDRGVIRIGMIDVAVFREGRYRDHNRAGTIAEKVDWLYISRIVQRSPQ